MLRSVTLLCWMLMSFSLVTIGFGQEQEKKPDLNGPAARKPAPKTPEEAEKDFVELLKDATMVGYFTTDGEDGEKPLKPDRYKIASVQKINGDNWLFVYIYKNAPLPLSLPVKWAGNTPVITLDDLTIPGLGTFSARVMFHGDRYAGTWQHGEKGGLMFGRIERKTDKPAAEPAKQ